MKGIKSLLMASNGKDGKSRKRCFALKKFNFYLREQIFNKGNEKKFKFKKK